MSQMRDALQGLLVDKVDPAGNELSPNESSLQSNLCSLFKSGDFQGVLLHALHNDQRWKELFRHLEKGPDDPDALGQLLDRFLDDGVEHHWEVVAVGVAALQLFVGLNWTQTSPVKSVNNDDDDTTEETEETVKEFTVNPQLLDRVLIDEVSGESLDVMVRRPELLFLAKLLLGNGVKVNNAFADDWVVSWWNLRAICVHFKVISQHSYPLYDRGNDVIAKLNSTDFPEKIYGARCAIETSLFYSHFFESSKAESWMEKAADVTGLEVHGTGAMGKRTYFQKFDTTHYVIEVKRREGKEAFVDVTGTGSEAETDAVVNIKLNDDTRRDKVLLTTPPTAPPPELNPTEQCVMMGLFYFLRKSEARTAITDTKLHPHLAAILDAPRGKQIWSTKVRALVERSKLETGEMKTVERALQQVETIVASLKNRGSNPAQRMKLIYTSGLPPTWEIEVELVRLYQSLGLTKSALEIALKLELWETVIDCYHRIELRHKAAEVIRAKMSQMGESPRLLCMLGDATDDEECYRRALTLSQGKSARALKSLGLRAYADKDYPRCIEYFTKSVEINRFQLTVLARLGYAAMQVEDWKAGAKAYREYCSFDSESFEAWNNLARCYVMLEEHTKAWNIFQEAAKRNYDNWQIWDNILTVSAKCGHFDEILRAYHRILDIRENKSTGSSHPNAAKMKEVADTNILGFLGNAIVNRTADSNGEDSVKLLGKTLELCARIAGLSPKDPEFFQVYAKLLAFDGELTEAVAPERSFKAAQMMQKGCAVHTTQSRDWHLTGEGCLKVSGFGLAYADSCLSASQHSANAAQSIQQLNAARMSLKSILSLVQKRVVNLQTGKEDEDLKERCQTVEGKVNEIVERVAVLKSSSSS